MQPQNDYPLGSITLDANGNGSGSIYNVPPAQRFTLHRIVVDDDVHNPGTPFTNAGGYVQVERGGVRVAWLSLDPAAGVAGGIPGVIAAGGSSGPQWQSREQITVTVVKGPANGTLLIRGQGTLDPIEFS